VLGLAYIGLLIDAGTVPTQVTRRWRIALSIGSDALFLADLQNILKTLRTRATPRMQSR
jgi:hypothetical protein